MRERGWLTGGVQVLLLVAIAALVAGQLLGQPVLLGFVETGSMEPTIEAGDGFVAVPSALTGEPEPGDIVVFDAEEIDGGGLTTHRVVDDTEAGYVTRGDANPFTDQDGGEPPVQDAQIVTVVPQIGGSPLTIPHLGTAVMAVEDGVESVQLWLATTFDIQSMLGTTGLAYLLLGLSLVAYAFESLRERRKAAFQSRRVSRRGAEIDPRLIAGAFALLVVVAAAAAMIVPAGSHSFDVVSSDTPSDRPLVIESGTTEEIPYEVPNAGYVPVLVYTEPGSDGVALGEETLRIEGRSEAETSLALTAPDETGHYQLFVTEYRYLHVVPEPAVDALYEVHPWLPVLVILGVLGGGTYALGRLLLGGPSPRTKRARLQRRSNRSNRTQFGAK